MPTDPAEASGSHRRPNPLVKHGLIVLGAGLLAGALGMFPSWVLDTVWQIPSLQEDRYTPGARRDPGDELVFVVIGSSSCAWSNLPEVASLVREARDSVVVQAAARQMGVAMMGVAKDIVAERGIRHLQRFGRFDEVTAGRGWRNSGIFRYVYDAFPGPAATPQVLVIARTLERTGAEWTISQERVLVRRVGLTEIRRWVKGGVRIPTGDSL